MLGKRFFSLAEFEIHIASSGEMLSRKFIRFQIRRLVVVIFDILTQLRLELSPRKEKNPNSNDLHLKRSLYPRH